MEFVEEEWRYLNKGDKDEYMVSSNGRIKKVSPKCFMLNPSINKDGYFATKIIFGKKYYTVHQLVSMVFFNHIHFGCGIVINHKNFDKLDNRVSNLELVTIRENVSHRKRKNSTGYTGVYFLPKTNRYRSIIGFNKKAVTLGSFDSAYEAKLAYDSALEKINNNCFVYHPRTYIKRK